MELPLVAICGRPNVGKSTLFNLLAGKKISIVDPTSGVTRDRVGAILNIDEKYFELMDTGGIGITDEQNLGEAITTQAKIAIERAAIVLLIVDIKEGIHPLDREIAELLRKYKDRVILVANKTDYPALAMEKDQFRRLGFSEPVCISATERFGIEELKDKLRERMSSFPEVEPQRAEMKVAVVGKPNVGKSTFINSLAGEERMIVSEIPGTTRDSVDVYFEKDEKVVIAIDTAGIKRRKNVKDNVEYYSQHRAQRSIRRADVTILMLDATTKISRVDKELADYIVSEHKIAIITVNKWDLVKNIPTTSYENYISKMLPNLHYAPLSFITAKSGKNVNATIDLARNLYKQAQKKTGTGELNRILEKILERKSPPVIYGQQGKLYYATQTGILPPSFLLFVNNPSLFTDAYKRYLVHQMQKELDYLEVPLKILLRTRKHKDELKAVSEGEEKNEQQMMI